MSATPLRRDLESIAVQGPKRPYRIVIDDVAGRFARVSEELWQRLQRGEEDPGIWAQAQSAGWTRHRSADARPRPSLFAIRIPLGGIDWLARRLVRASAVLFSVGAIAFWSLFIAIAMLIAVSRSSEIFGTLGSLSQFLNQTSPITLAIVFVLTKVAHELGHAVMCRRMGARCGDVGVLLLCGMPCPYCDVTQIWRQSSAVRRAAVMLAGIYVELIIASAATFAWAYSSDPAIRFGAMNLMIVCGVSTLVFNANPLMRYDGYFVLSDILGSTNLRQESRNAFRSVVTRRIAGPRYASQIRSDVRGCSLAVYHLASKAYRLIVTCTIAAIMISVAQWMHLRPVAVSLVLLGALLIVKKNILRATNALRGSSRWQSVSVLRRISVIGFLVVFCIGVFFVPLPRFRPASGIVDAANAVSIYLPRQQVVTSTPVEYGDEVTAGDTIVQIAHQAQRLSVHRLEGQLRLAKLRSQHARLDALDSSKPTRARSADRWQMLRASENAVTAQLASARDQLSRSSVRAGVTGLVIPAQPSIDCDEEGKVATLGDRLGQLGSTDHAWCRISRDTSLHAALVIDASDRPRIQRGSKVRLTISSLPNQVFDSWVTSVSEIKSDDRLVVGSAAYQVLCELPICDRDAHLAMIGQECRGVFQLPRTSFASELKQWLSEWLRG